MMIDINKHVSNFELPGTNNLQFKLSDYIGKEVVLYFYPKDSTPGCTNEGIDFKENINKFNSNNIYIFGISRDSIKSHENFKKKYSFPFELLSDSDEEVCNQFDVIKEKSMYGKSYKGIERSTFIINSKGILSHEWRGVKVPGHVNEILKTFNL
jgi:peroxiredoxin Q/BCP|tara:strand:- start:20 stop:481 length:462 start_codon:yes stop_codon:yes gene_type:complete